MPYLDPPCRRSIGPRCEQTPCHGARCNAVGRRQTPAEREKKKIRAMTKERYIKRDLPDADRHLQKTETEMEVKTGI